MSNPRDSYQLYECPQEFQDRLTEVGGRNKYDQPNFLCVWGMGGNPSVFIEQEDCGTTQMGLVSTGIETS